eukprot:TRINITY_DN7804_c0_g2_i1.p2 TRINITY_DN7804_c0_g2~~TRINITY_DN7804_c0_g2_i1.p2  ORF type:complete len:123 (+),score=28.18 TRINITY_DN7804_c0_g2_i1:124-492(+)
MASSLQNRKHGSAEKGAGRKGSGGEKSGGKGGPAKSEVPSSPKARPSHWREESGLTDNFDADAEPERGIDAAADSFNWKINAVFGLRLAALVVLGWWGWRLVRKGRQRRATEQGAAWRKKAM